MKTAIIHVSFIQIYEYKGWRFEYDRRKPFGPWPLKKDDEPRARAGIKFYRMFGEFNLMSDEQQETFRVE